MAVVLENMFSGIPFSPPTKLAQPLAANATSIPVEDGAVFPPGPNFATIGTDEEAETVMYTAVAGNQLTGVTRGIEGVPTAWQTDEQIGRNWTYTDYQRLITNIIRIRDTTMRFVGADGKTYAFQWLVDTDTGGLVFRYEEVSA